MVDPQTKVVPWRGPEDLPPDDVWNWIPEWRRRMVRPVAPLSGVRANIDLQKSVIGLVMRPPRGRDERSPSWTVDS